CIAGITFSIAIFAAPSTPQRIFLVMARSSPCRRVRFAGTVTESSDAFQGSRQARGGELHHGGTEGHGDEERGAHRRGRRGETRNHRQARGERSMEMRVRSPPSFPCSSPTLLCSPA